jgi:hypothetical protein
MTWWNVILDHARSGFACIPSHPMLRRHAFEPIVCWHVNGHGLLWCRCGYTKIHIAHRT